MSIINTTTLATATQADIDALTTSCSYDSFTLLAATITANDNISSTIANTSLLPDLSTTNMEGTIIHVTSLGVPLIATNKKWMGLDGRCFRQDCSDNTLWTWGTGGGGGLASGNQTERCSPVREISSGYNWCDISGGLNNGGGVKTNGSLWMWGCGNYGQNGDGTTQSRCSPVREASSSSNWCRVSAPGSRLSAGIKSDGSLWTWGRGIGGQLGNGVGTACVCSPVREYCSATNWNRVSAAVGNHVLAIKTDGSLWAWGCAGNGILGDGTTTAKCSPVREFCSATNWCTVSGGQCHSLAVKTDGSLWSWGNNNQGQLGVGYTSVGRCTPVREACAASDWCAGNAGTTCISMGLKTDGSLWSWGYNQAGALGCGGTASSTLPVREFCSATNWCKGCAGRQNVAAVKTDGSLWAWGCNAQGILGNGNTTNVCSPVREICSATDWTCVSMGFYVAMGIRRL